VKHLRRSALLIGAIILATIVGSTAFAARTIAFKGTYAGTVTEKVDGVTVTALAVGSGTGTLVGKSKLAGTVTATTADPPCSPLSGPGTIAGAVGKLKVALTPTSRGCAASEEDRDNVLVSGTAKVVGGTLKFKKARGTLRFSGQYDRKAGTFSVKLTGTFTY